MTATTAKTKARVPAQPYEHHEGLPVFRSGDAPEELRTETQLKNERLKLAEEQKPHAYLRIYRRGTGWMRVPLYSPGEAVKMRPLSAHQQRQKTARRTCARCGIVQARPISPNDYVTCWPGKPDQHCPTCLAELYTEWCHTCDGCGTRFENTHVGSGTCPACKARRERAYVVVHRLIRRHCPECGVRTATQAEIEEADTADTYGRVHEFPRTCQPCRAEQKRQAEECRRAADRARWDELGPVRQWARKIVAEPSAFAILDTETTGLDSDAKVVEISITDGSGRMLLDTLVNPGVPIPDEAREIHGIADEDVCDAPRFGEILPALTEALAGRRVVIYNADYDERVLAYELDRHHREHTPATELSEGKRHPAAAAWMKSQRWDQCAMLAYAVHVGDWSDYHGDWQWQRLGGGHRALGDCQRVAEIIKEMAEVPDPF
ncbi:3'-5' exonuclease [Streptomyces sp. HUAS TT7]|uniref:3'-5' exonuclease n=1 Tax=Streptomyces sp. HUAS TT7 TaxID=3447507 RepID=UPI003F658FD3